MPRTIQADADNRLWRARVTTIDTAPDGTERRSAEEIYGPYTNKGTANAQITRARRGAKRWERITGRPARVESVLEFTIIDWQEAK